MISDCGLARRGFRNTIIGCTLCFLMGALFAALLCLNPDAEGLSSRIYTGHGIYYGISINAEQIRTRGPPATTNIVEALIVGVFSGALHFQSQVLACSGWISGQLTG